MKECPDKTQLRGFCLHTSDLFPFCDNNLGAIAGARWRGQNSDSGLVDPQGWLSHTESQGWLTFPTNHFSEGFPADSQPRDPHLFHPCSTTPLVIMLCLSSTQRRRRTPTRTVVPRSHRSCLKLMFGCTPSFAPFQDENVREKHRRLRYLVCRRVAASFAAWSEGQIFLFCNSATTQPVCARTVVEMGSHPTRRVPVQSHNSFLNQSSRSQEPYFVQCENPVLILMIPNLSL